jgi:hypothetical protein
MSFTKLRLVALFLAAVASTIAGGAWFAQTPSPKHTIVVTFDYDFTAVPACSEKVSKKCIAKFVVYDISGEKPYKLFTIPVPAGAAGKVKGISGESQPFSSLETLIGCRRRGKARRIEPTPLPSGRRFRRKCTRRQVELFHDLFATARRT